MTDPNGAVTSYTYDLFGRVTSIAYPNGISAGYTYNSKGELLSIVDLKGTSVTASYSYTYDTAGNLIEDMESGGRTVTYGYDRAGQLTSQTIVDPVLGNQQITYTYDGDGNRLTQTDATGTTVYTYDANGRLLGAGSTTYTYDANGDMLSKTVDGQVTSYSYNSMNLLVKVVTGSSVSIYQYDGDGNRIASTVNGQTVHYVVDANQTYPEVIEERDSQGNLIEHFTYGIALVSQSHGTQTSYFLTDAQGSTRLLTNSTGSVTDSYVYDAFGLLIAHNGQTVNAYLYTGEMLDPTGLYYLRSLLRSVDGSVHHERHDRRFRAEYGLFECLCVCQRQSGFGHGSYRTYHPDHRGDSGSDQFSGSDGGGTRGHCLRIRGSQRVRGRTRNASKRTIRVHHPDSDRWCRSSDPCPVGGEYGSRERPYRRRG